MNRLYSLLLMAFTCGATLLLFSSCATTPPSKFYTLHALTDTISAKQKGGSEKAIGVEIGPLSLPAFLDRPQIVTRTNSTELIFAEFDRWAEPLDKNISAVLTENLSILIPSDSIYSYPWRGSPKVDFQVAINVVRFDVTSDGRASFVVRWTIYEGNSREVLLKKKSHFTESANSNDYHSLVSALNKTLEDFSRKVAATIKGLRH
ncbi:MAG: membrane integrity-associated transporter subunit PqiC [Deltaproteobacteria bacterium]|nr:membrane integrity-associated transporter subunit PqiC [Deltaproteobacteria bacterium]